MKNLFSLIFIVLIFQGCCHIPFVDCFYSAKAKKAKPSPILIEIGSSNHQLICQFKYNQFYEHYSRDILWSQLYVNLSSNEQYIALLDKSKITLNNKLNKFSTLIDILHSESQGNNHVKNFEITFSNCCEQYPIKIQIDSLPIVFNRTDTSYIDTTITIVERKIQF